jgi:hypothetical protein
MTNQTRTSFPFPLLLFWLRQILLMWCLIGFIIFITQILHCGICKNNESIKAISFFIDKMPSILKSSLGGNALQMGNISSFIAIAYIHPLILILYMIFAVSVPTGFLAGHVQNGYMELILSRSVTKTQVYIYASFLTFAGMFALVTVMFLGTVFGINIYDFGQKIPLYPFFRAAVNGALLAGAGAGVSLLCAASFRTRGWAVGLAVAYLVASHLIHIFAEWGPLIKFLEPISLFNYIHPQKILNESAWPIRDMSVLAAVMIIATIAGGIIWRKRDLPL